MRKMVFLIGLTLSLLFPFSISTQEREDETVKFEGYGELKVSKSHSHKNLEVFIIYREKPYENEQEFITLEEGLKKDVVKVTEKEQATVQTLQVRNLSDKPLFIQIGDLLKGGKQDRTIQASIVIPPTSEFVNIPSLCVEQRRWSGFKEFGVGGGGCGGRAVTKKMKQAIQDKKQDEVWNEVAEVKGAIKGRIIGEVGERAFAGRLTSSINEELEHKKVEKATEEFEKALGEIINKYTTPVGLAFAINGELNTIEIYGSSSLFKKVYPKLLRSAAIEAMITKGEEKKVKSKSIVELLNKAIDGTKREEKLDENNMRKSIKSSYHNLAQTNYKGSPIHSQIIKKDEKVEKKEKQE